MNKSTALFLLLFHFSFSQKKCETGTMGYLDFQTSYTVEKAPKLKVNEKDFIIVLDAKLKQDNFVSLEEDYFRNEISQSDEQLLKHILIQDKSPEERKEYFRKYRIDQLKYVDSLHNAALEMDEVWLINKSRKTCGFLLQDGSLIMVLEAQNENKEWKPITYWFFNWCGNSYFPSYSFKGDEGIRVRFKLPKEGDYITKLRFKVNGYGKFYYSNIFNGKIDYCSFFDDPKNDSPFKSKLEDLFDPY